MKRAILSSAVMLAAGFLIASENAPENPRFTKDNELVRPANYREWIYVTSGLGMSYGPAAARESSSPFDNVFVEPTAYRAFKETGKWPDKTIFVLELRSATGHGSINRAGHFQTDLVAVEAAVKDEARFPEKWAYFGFGGPGTTRATAKAFPKEACHSCHSKNAAVENTFVQFYPTLLEIAEAKGTLNASYPRPAPTPGKISQIIRADGWPAAEAALRNAKAKDPEAAIFEEASLNTVAYQVFEAGKKQEAIAVLRYAIDSYPASANLQDSLSETYEKSGQKDLALQAARKALELLPADKSDAAQKEAIAKSATARIKKLSAS